MCHKICILYFCEEFRTLRVDAGHFKCIYIPHTQTHKVLNVILNAYCISEISSEVWIWAFIALYLYIYIKSAQVSAQEV